MSGKTDFHLNIFSDSQRHVFPSLARALADTDFYLAGGTALALYIGHRPSVDFDWFITRLGEPERLFQKLRAFEVDFDVQSVALETVYLAIDAVQVSFIGYNYPLLQPPRMMGEPGVRLADPDDIACMKLSAIASRGLRKDFVDLYFMINRFRSLKDYLHLYRIKYQNRDIGHLMRSLVYFGDAEMEPEIVTVKSFDWQKMKEDFERWVRDLGE